MNEMRTHKASMPVLLTPREAASTLRLDVSTIYRMIDRGTIGAVQFGGSGHTVRIPAAELVRLSASEASSWWSGVLWRWGAGSCSCNP
jgi:excisionase family DNA binding protein